MRAPESTGSRRGSSVSSSAVAAVDDDGGMDGNDDLSLFQGGSVALNVGGPAADGAGERARGVSFVFRSEDDGAEDDGLGANAEAGADCSKSRGVGNDGDLDEGEELDHNRLSLEYSADGESFTPGTSKAALRSAFGNSRYSSRFLSAMAVSDDEASSAGPGELASPTTAGSGFSEAIAHGQRGPGGVHGMIRSPSSGTISSGGDELGEGTWRRLGRSGSIGGMQRKYSAQPGPTAIDLSDDGETTVCCEACCTPCVWHAVQANGRRPGNVEDGSFSALSPSGMGMLSSRASGSSGGGLHNSSGGGGDSFTTSLVGRARRWLVRMWVLAIIESSWLCLLLLGVGSSALAWSIDEAVALLVVSKAQVANLAQSSIVSYFVWTLFTMAMALGAVVVTKRISPLAAGSGIPQIRSILAGFEIRGYLSLRTLVAKVSGLVLAQACGMVIGKEGPFVHISCILATQLLRLPLFAEIRESPALKKQLLAAACAVGVSSTFGAPIGGVLFSIEVTSSLYQTSQYWKSFFCVVCGALAFRELSNYGQSRNNVVSLFTTNFEPLPYTVLELPVFVLLSVVCGYLAGAFVLCYQKMAEFRKAGPRYVSNSYSFALIVAFLTSAALFPLGDFMQYSLHNAIDDLLINDDIGRASHSRLWDQPTKFINLLLFAWLKFVLAVLAITLPIPCGVFTPVFAVGAAIGRFFGEILQDFGAHDVTPGGYALVGAASFTAGATGTVSTAVIVFELTNQLSYMLPVLLSVLIGVASARNVGPNIYDALSISKNLPHFPQFTRQSSYSLPVRKVMHDHIALVPRFVTKQGVEAALLRADNFNLDPYYLFAVVDSLEEGHYLGSVTWKALHLIKANDRLWAQPVDCDPDDSRAIDILKHCGIDHSTLALPHWTSLNDANNYFDIHKRKAFFVVSKSKVIGKLNLKDISKGVDSGNL